MIDEIPFTREFVADDRFASRAARALIKGLYFRQPVAWAPAMFVVLGLLLLELGADPSLGLLFVAMGPLLFVLAPLFAYRRAKQMLRTRQPVGSRLRTGFGSARFAVESPTISLTVDYTEYSAARRRGDFVFLRQSSTRVWELYPGVLFSDEDLERFPGDKR